jgi:hypothetical protein
MKTKLAVLLLGLLLGGAAVAQPVPQNPEIGSAPANESLDTPIAVDDPSAIEDAQAENRSKFTTRSLKLEKAHPQTTRRVEPASRAWTTQVGWQPGDSAFGDPMTHESKLILFSFQIGKQR